MNTSFTTSQLKKLIKAQQGELDAVLMYRALARLTNNTLETVAFKRLASDEGRHAVMLKNLTGKNLAPGRSLERMITALYAAMPKKTLYKSIARGEYAGEKTYSRLMAELPDIPQLENIKNDERRHGDIMNQLAVSASD